jgi:hypothetical protein
MNITGNAYRSFYNQTGISWAIQVTAPLKNSETRFYVSSNSGDKQVFGLVSGSILSNTNALVGSFRGNELLNFSGNLNSYSSDLYLNTNPLYLGASIAANQNFTGFKIKNFSNSEIGLGYLNIAGNSLPSFSYTKSQIFPPIFNTGAISIVNSGSSPLIIFSGQCNNKLFSLSGKFPLASIAAGSTGYLYLANATNFDYTNTSQSISLNLDTNIGNINLESVFLARYSGANFPYLSISPYIDLINNGETNSYNLTCKNPNLSSLSVSLSYVTGYTGNVFIPTTVSQLISQQITGTISGVGVLSAYLSNKSGSTGIPFFSVSNFNTITQSMAYGPASGVVESDTIIAPSQFVTGQVIGQASGLATININKTGIAIGKVRNFNIYSGYINFITGGYITGNYPTGMPMYNTYFDDNTLLSGQLISPITGLYTFTPNNVIYLPSGALQNTQYSQKLLNANITKFITGSFSYPWGTTGVAYVTGNPNDISNIYPILVGLTGLYNFVIPNESFSGQLSLDNERVTQFIKKDTLLIPLSTNVPGNELRAAYDQQCVGYLKSTIFPSGECSISNTFTGFFYNPVTTGIYFNKTLSVNVTGRGLLSATVTGSVYSVDSTVVLPYFSTIYSQQYVSTPILIPLTGLMQTVTKKNFYNKLVYSNFTKNISGITTNGFYSQSNSRELFSGSSQIISPFFSIGDDGFSIFNFNDTGAFSFNDYLTGEYYANIPSITTGTFMASGYLTGTIYNYAGNRGFNKLWNISTGLSANSIINLDLNKNNIYPSDMGVSGSLTSLLTVSYNDLYSINGENGAYDAALLTVSGNNFIENGISSGISILIRTSTSVPLATPTPTPAP